MARDRLIALVAAMAFAAPLPAVAATGDLAAYMRARVADADGAPARAAADFARALAADPDNATVAEQAYRAAIGATDDALVDRALATLARAGALPADAPLVMVAAAAQAHDMTAARAAIARLKDGRLKLLAPPLEAWLAIDTGGDPFAPLSARPVDPVARRLAEETRGLRLLALGRTGEGLATLRVVLGNEASSQDNRIAAARLLAGRGQLTEARAMLVGDAPAIVALRERLRDEAAARREGEKASLTFGAAQLFTRVGDDLAVGEPGPLSFALAAAAIRANPRADRARLLLADALAQQGATDRAMAVLDSVPMDSIHARVAAVRRVQVLTDAGRRKEALAIAAPLAAAPGAEAADLQRVGTLYLALDRPAEAVPLFERAVAQAGDAAGWADWLRYGAALDRAGRWKEARAALERARTLRPDEPIVLNYLGYAMVEHGESGARAMLEQAVRLKPDDAAIADSLGWALFRGGEVARALPLIERAAQAEPDSVEIAEHLGDVYWASGRRFEARYAWTAARQTAEPAVAERLTTKIADGL